LEQPLTIDFELRADGFWMVVQNISAVPLASFTAAFSLPIFGLPIRGNATGARIVVSDYELFTSCQYLVPGKKFEFFVENELIFFQINPAEFKIAISTIDASGQGAQYTIAHNLNIYTQLIQTTIINQ